MFDKPLDLIRRFFYYSRHRQNAITRKQKRVEYEFKFRQFRFVCI
nr:MAG TPA: hypothetical protein [Caudoviricetes sp.]